MARRKLNIVTVTKPLLASIGYSEVTDPDEIQEILETHMYEEMPNIGYEGEDDSIYQLSKDLDFNKIKRVKWSDPEVKNIKFTPWIDIYKFDTVQEAAFEADYGLAFLLYRYMKVYGKTPTFLTLHNGVLPAKFFDNFIKNLNPPRNSYYTSNRFDNKTTEMGMFNIAMDTNIFYFDGHNSFLIYDPDSLQNEDDPLHSILGIIKSYKRPNVVKNTLYVVYRTEHGFQKKPFQVKKKKIDLNDNYNDDFPKVSEDIIRKLNNKGKTGLVILHGEPGTGKTTYIRYLAGKLKRDIIFISPDMVHHITSPEFIPFLMDNSNAILIIEDAEPVLQKRDGDERSGAVSNILNMTDGLLSDCLNISIVATFNTKMSNVDEALRRQGRLLREYKFDKLDVDKAQSLMDKNGKNVKVTEPMSLAEIYFYGDEISDDASRLQRKKVGFGN